jgi:c-di-GMP-binding flagellar brake protein YcgR
MRPAIEEKRRYKRLESVVPLQYRNLKKSAEVSKGSLTKNIGEGGICFKTSEFISLACRLVIELELPAVPKPIKAISKVAWIRKLPTANLYEIGNQFLEMSKEDKKSVINFIEESLNINSPAKIL